MNCKPNIGIVNALIRITIGLTILSCSTARLVTRPWRQSNLLFAILGAMKVAEGIVRYCPVTALFQCGQEQLNKERQNKEENKELEEMIPYNPT
ncbi:DUF2892 domain-containing protein [Bacillus sp. FJAT-49705]|uniref:DUF2892 domain-containing protein n=1 Tax=Cytobacillus citreus TaxID=2833586 RepID=A0ABS5NVH2_9BACI|nr:DUF2892 domain-containing protein [Cytobacillus citreus]MBS4191829.1 DUF2892 domain-containing protein [Cytobacillus citreus]